MVSTCKVCGEETRGHRQYCPYCRQNFRGRNPRDSMPSIITLFILIVFVFFVAKYLYTTEGLKASLYLFLLDGIFVLLLIWFIRRVLKSNRPMSIGDSLNRRVVSKQVIR